MVEIKNQFVCICSDFDIKETAIKEYFKDVLKKVQNSLKGDDFSDILAQYFKKLQNKKLEDVDEPTESKVSLGQQIIQHGLDEDSVYILDKNTWENASTVLIMEIGSCLDNKVKISFDLRTIKDQFNPEDFELSYKPLNILINNVSMKKISGICCGVYSVPDSTNLLINPDNWSIIPPANLLSKLGDFKTREYRLTCEKSELGISAISVEKISNKIRVDLSTKFTKDLSVDLLQNSAKHNFEAMMSLLNKNNI